MKIVIAGSSGFIGSKLVSHFKEKGHELILLSRNPQEGQHFWDPEAKQIDPSILAGVDVVINLAGESILGRWNQKKMERIRESRFDATQFLCDTLISTKTMPRTFLNASAIGYYGDRGEEVLTESSQSGHGFLAEVCRHWERIPDRLAEKGVRVVLMRFGLVLGDSGGALKQMEKPFRMGMGGTLGKGEQIMSWIAIDDLVSAVDFLIDHEEISGPVNFTAPGALSNLEFTRIFSTLLGKPAPLPIPKFALSMLFGSGVEIFLASLHARPDQLLKSGFPFQYANIEECLKKYLHLNEKKE
ncbi:MAG: TIGR01777 family oxidoreductase [Chlamydiales bacterium]|nr:TIGR01777 family oxidoreductase [Chlamydiales bacterium]